MALPDDTARAYSVKVTEAVFIDKTIWTATETEWEQIPSPVSLYEKLQDSELIKQYKLEYGNDCEYAVSEVSDLWYCSCGDLNKKESQVCSKCGKVYSSIKTINVEKLRAKYCICRMLN